MRRCGFLHLVFLSGLAATFVLSAAPATADTLFMVHSPQVLNLERLYSEAGMVFPTDSFPISRKRLDEYARRLKEEVQARPVGRPGGMASSIDAYLKELDYQPGKLRIGGTNRFTYEEYVVTKNAPALDFAQQLALIDPLFAASLYFGADGGSEVNIKASLYRQYNEYTPGTIFDNFPTALPGNPFPVENNDLRDGYLYVPLGWGSATFGRQQLQIGPTLDNTSLTATERLPFYDALRVRMPIGNLTMTWVISTLENRQAVQDVSLATSPNPDIYGFGANQTGRTIILYNIHYFEYNFRRLRLGIGAQEVLSRPNNMFNLGDFFPVFSWHEANIAVNNLCLFGDASLTPLPGLDLYFQGGLDDVGLGGIGIADSATPTIWAYELGARHDGKIKTIPYRASLEWGATHYLWGNYSWPGDISDNNLSRSIYRMFTDGGVQAIPLTSAYGPGTTWLIGKVTATTDFGVSGTAKLTWLTLNPDANLFTTPYQASATVANYPKSNEIIAELIGRYDWRRYASFEVNPRLIIYNGQASFELNLHVEAKLDFEKVFGK